MWSSYSIDDKYIHSDHAYVWKPYQGLHDGMVCIWDVASYDWIIAAYTS